MTVGWWVPRLLGRGVPGGVVGGLGCGRRQDARHRELPNPPELADGRTYRAGLASAQLIMISFDINREVAW